MSLHEWNIIAFSLTVLIAVLAWWMAWVAYSRHRQSYLHRTLALSVFFFGFWILSGWIEKIFSAPSDGFTTITYHWAYMAGFSCLTFYVLFALAMWLGKKPPREYLNRPGFIGGSVA